MEIHFKNVIRIETIVKHAYFFKETQKLRKPCHVVAYGYSAFIFNLLISVILENHTLYLQKQDWYIIRHLKIEDTISLLVHNEFKQSDSRQFLQYVSI